MTGTRSPQAQPVALVAHSSYSLGHGVAVPERLVTRAAELGIHAMALTDIETLGGQVRFHAACRDAGVAPITGVELRSGFSRRNSGDLKGRLILIAADEQGYAKLCQLVSARREGGGRDSLTPDPVASLPDNLTGLFVITEDSDLVRRLLRARPDSLAAIRLLITDATEPLSLERIVAASRETGIQVVASPQVTALGAEDLATHDLLRAIRSRGAVAQSFAAGRVAHAQLRPFGSDSLTAIADHEAAANAARALAAACTLDLTSRPVHQPRLPELAPGAAVGVLREKCLAGELPSDEHRTRLERELAVIEALGYSDYFLAVAVIVEGARRLGVPTAGRGSSAGSLVAHVLGITTLDPLRHDLLFERFLNDRRSQPPDIDLDVASTGRERLRDWVAERFGRDRVAGIAAYFTFRPRSAVRHGLAALGMPPGRIAILLRGFRPASGSRRDEAAYVEEFLRTSGDRGAQQAASSVASLVGLPSHASAHPAGVVIGDGPLNELLPLERAPGGTIVTQYDHRSVELAGFLKIDILGNHFLSELHEALSLSGATGPNGHNDPATLRTLDVADTIGCFQVESPAMRSVLRRMPVRSFDDLVAALAIVRPGAAAGASKERYLKRSRGEENFDPLGVIGGAHAVPGDGRFQDLAERLATSYGVVLFDEDIMHLLSKVAGVDLAEADRLRTAIIDLPPRSREAVRLAQEFEASAVRSGTPASVAQRAWAVAERFASYSFARAHAASYADLAWQAAWLRTYLPIEFGCAVINHHQGIYPARTVAAAIQRWGVEILPPHVDHSGQMSTVHDQTTRRGVLLGLRTVKWLTKRTAADIVANRPFSDLSGFIDRVHPSQRELTALILSGACDGLAPLAADQYPFAHESVLAQLSGEPAPGQSRESSEQTAHYRRLVRVRNELAYLGMHVSDHPMRLLRLDAEELGCVTAAEVNHGQAGTATRSAAVAGLVAASRRVRTDTGEIRFITIEDETGLLEGVLPATAVARLGTGLTTSGPYLFRGVPRREGDASTLVIGDLVPFHQRP